MVYIAGAGIGEKYISVYCLELVKSCDVIIYDRLIDSSILEYAKSDCVKIYAGKAENKHSMKQSEINSLIVSMAKKYKRVLRLKGGDPFVFGRGGEEACVCEKYGIAYEVVPGVTSAIAVPEICGIPVTHRGISQDVHIITGHTAEKNSINYEALAKMTGTIVVLMGVKRGGTIGKELIKYGMDENTPAAFIEKGGTSDERVIRTVLSKCGECVKENNIFPPAVLVIGKTAGMELRYRKKTAAIIGTREFKSRLCKRLYNYNIADMGTMEVKINDFHIDTDCEYIVLTSRNGANIFGEYLKNNNIDIRSLRSIKFAVIGRGTYDALAQYGIYADIMPDKYSSTDLSKELSKYKGKKLILRAEKGSDDIYKYIDNYEDVKIYSLMGKNIKKCSADYYIFGSGGAVEEYCGKYDIKGNIIAIGPVTEKKLKEYGYSPYVAEKYSIDGIIEKLEEIENEKNEKIENKC